MMKKLIFLILAVAFSHASTFSQGCLPEGITFTTQAQVDSFPINYPGCAGIVGDLTIDGNDITDLNGLSLLTSIGGNLLIGGYWGWDGNPVLSSINGLINLTSIGGNLTIGGNPVLNSLVGLENLVPSSIDDLKIVNNFNLSDCEVQSICSYLANPGGVVEIHDNAPGCNNPKEVADSCGIILTCLPYGNYYFSSQSDIDSFQSNFPGCSDLEGDVFIHGLDITNLNGLNVITSIHGSLSIGGWPYMALTNLNGLGNLASIGGSLWIVECNSLINLTGLSNLDSITGRLYIGSNDSLINLEGLNHLNYLGSLEVKENDLLNSLSGLEGVTSTGFILLGHHPDMGGTGLTIGNPSLTSLEGLNNLTSVNGDFLINMNGSLSDISSLQNLTFIGGRFHISTNILNTLGGLDNLDSIGGSLEICGNPALSNISSLYNLTSIGGDLRISGNSLSNLTGLDNIAPNSIANLAIVSNPSLTVCSAQSICGYLVSPNGVVDIYNNAPGCNNPPEVADGCGITLPCLPFGNYYLITQDEIDYFSTDYPGCSELEGNVTIYGSGIDNLIGLSVISSIGGDLSIRSITSLTDLTGLDNLTGIGGDLRISDNESLSGLTGISALHFIGGDLRISDNESLSGLTGISALHFIGGDLNISGDESLDDLEGISSLDSIGGDLYIAGNPITSLSGFGNLLFVGGDLSIVDNSSLVNINAIDNLNRIGGDIHICNNLALTSLTGLDNIDASSIHDLKIQYNTSLSTCEVQSVCDYLAAPGGTIFIDSNAPGCNSRAEVEDACGIIGVEALSYNNNFSICPNPSTSQIIIETSAMYIPGQLSILNLNGQQLIHRRVTEPKTVIDISNLPGGVYLLQITNDRMVETIKLIKQ